MVKYFTKTAARSKILAASGVMVIAMMSNVIPAFTPAAQAEEAPPIKAFTVGDSAKPGLYGQFYGRFDAGLNYSTGSRGLNLDGTQSTHSSIRFGDGQLPNRLGVRGGVCL